MNVGKKKCPYHCPDIGLRTAIIDGHAAVASEHIRSDLEVSRVGVLIAQLIETRRGVEVVGEVVDGDFQLIGGEVRPREEAKVIEQKTVADAEEASKRSQTVPLTEVELVTMFQIIPEGTLPRR